jgi:hypothetical protein
MDEPLIDDDKVVITGEHLQIGHWCPAEERGEDNLFLIEDAIHQPVKFSVDVTSRTVEVRLQPADHMMNFRFKDLQGVVGLFHAGSSYAIAFRLKYPPRIYRLTHGPDRYGVLEEIATRSLEMGGVRNETFGSCYGYMVQISCHNVGKLFDSKTNLLKMKQFGLLSRDLYSLLDARQVATRFVGGDRDRIVLLLHRTADRHVGKLPRAITDSNPSHASHFCCSLSRTDASIAYGQWAFLLVSRLA